MKNFYGDPFLQLECPHCGETMVLAVPNPEMEAGTFDYDCEVCCRPFVVSWNRQDDGFFEGEAFDDQ